MNSQEVFWECRIRDFYEDPELYEALKLSFEHIGVRYDLNITDREIVIQDSLTAYWQHYIHPNPEAEGEVPLHTKWYRLRKIIVRRIIDLGRRATRHRKKATDSDFDDKEAEASGLDGVPLLVLRRDIQPVLNKIHDDQERRIFTKHHSGKDRIDTQREEGVSRSTYYRKLRHAEDSLRRAMSA